MTSMFVTERIGGAGSAPANCFRGVVGARFRTRVSIPEATGQRQRVLPLRDSVTIASSSYCALLQSTGVIVFSVAYLADTSSTRGSVRALSPLYQSDETFHSLPSHVCTRAWLVPSWSEHESLTGPMTPSKPSTLMRSAVRSRFSRPQRTCSPVSGFLPYFSCALRMPSTPIMALTRPRTYSTSPESSHFACDLLLSKTNFLRSSCSLKRPAECCMASAEYPLASAATGLTSGSAPDHHQPSIFSRGKPTATASFMEVEFMTPQPHSRIQSGLVWRTCSQVAFC